MPTVRVALAQLNVTVGALDANSRRIAAACRHANAWLADLVVVPELAIPGYPPEDLLLKPQFIEANRRALDALVPHTRGLTALVGFVDRDQRGRLYNAAAVLSDGRHVATYQKQCLPNYGVFDEQRYFTPGTTPLLVRVGGAPIGVTICEDLWDGRPVQAAAAQGARLLVNLSASPYHAGKLRERRQLFAKRARANRLAIAYCNLVGGQDELVFDGASFALDASGGLLAQGPQFVEGLTCVDIAVPSAAGSARAPRIARPPLPKTRAPALEDTEEIYAALTLGLRDYVRKNGFSAVVLGLSGGIDSALTACLAVDALGADHVQAVVMPSRFSSAKTQADAKTLGQALGIAVHEYSIEPIFHAYLATLKPSFGGREMDVTEQNIQARIRGALLMALSNKFGWLVLTTGNKSEMATGYCTLYGDMAGGLAIIKDVPKTLVYQLARLRNQRGPGSPIPRSVLHRPPTAELAPNQRDQDTLPPYAVLDPIVKAYVEENRSLDQILRTARTTPSVVRRVLGMIDRAEYKRRQGPPGIKITPKAFGKDRRMPITNQYDER